MIKIDKNTNPKALNLDAIQDCSVKVTLGFKCAPELKIRLAEEAEELGLTLSNYTGLLVEHAKSIVDRKTEEIDILINKIKQQEILIEFYESPRLKMLFKNLENQSASYFDSNGNKINITIRTISDVYTVLINSFQTTN